MLAAVEPDRRIDGSLKQRGLAQTRFAEDHERPAPSGPGGLDQTVECLYLVFSAQQLQNLDLRHPSRAQRPVQHAIRVADW